MPHTVLAVRRFAGPVIAVYLLHWGLWSLVHEAAQLTMSVLTSALIWITDHFFGGFPLIERAGWSAHWLAIDSATYGLLPIVCGLLIAAWIWQRRRKSWAAPAA
jgi:hypothetical protein